MSAVRQRTAPGKTADQLTGMIYTIKRRREVGDCAGVLMRLRSIRDVARLQESVVL